jgi:hypothetical protein
VATTFAPAVSLEGLRGDLVEAGGAHLRGHVGGGRLVPGGAPGVRPERGERRGVTQGGFAVDRHGEKEAEEGGHSRARL